MISDEEVAQLFQRIQGHISKHHPFTGALPHQLIRGVSELSWEKKAPGGCNQYKAIFNHSNIIPKYCFSCYKVYIEPRNVLELFKLMMIFNQLNLPDDNTRKAIVEIRPEIPGSYKGFIYSQQIDQAEELLNMAQIIVAEKISNKIPISIKRGCSEFAIPYPEFAHVEHGKTSMAYNDDWQQQEDLASKDLVIQSNPIENDIDIIDTYSLKDYKTMIAWLKYAATIGDDSYLKVSNVIRKPFKDLKRPTPFSHVNNER